MKIGIGKENLAHAGTNITEDIPTLVSVSMFFINKTEENIDKWQYEGHKKAPAFLSGLGTPASFLLDYG
jgi:hypothetical protein